MKDGHTGENIDPSNPPVKIRVTDVNKYDHLANIKRDEAVSSSDINHTSPTNSTPAQGCR